MLFSAMFSGDEQTFGKLLYEIVKRSFSYHDFGDKEPERVYQAFVLGLMVHLRDQFYVRSNRESGLGRYDVALVPMPTSVVEAQRQEGMVESKRWPRRGVVFELKSIDAKGEDAIEKALDEAMEQIERLDYDTELREAQAEKIVRWGVVFDGKQVWVRVGVSE